MQLEATFDPPVKATHQVLSFHRHPIVPYSKLKTDSSGSANPKTCVFEDMDVVIGGKHLESSITIWPPGRIAQGVLTIRPTPSLKGGMAMRMTIQHQVLTLRPESPNKLHGGVETVYVSTDKLLIKVAPWHFDMFTLSCKVDELSEAPFHEVFCYAADQTARNKWLAVFRRMGVTVRKTKLSPQLRPSGSFSDLELLHRQDTVTESVMCRRLSSFDDLPQVQIQRRKGAKPPMMSQLERVGDVRF